MTKTNTHDDDDVGDKGKRIHTLAITTTTTKTVKYNSYTHGNKQ